MTENNGEYQSHNLIKRIEHLEAHLAEVEKVTQSKSVDLSKEIFSLQSIFKELSNQWESNQEFYNSLIHWTGYSLLALTLLYYISLFIPLRFMNPIWELQIVASLVDNIPMFFLGLLFVFYGNQVRPKIEKIILSVISWSALAFGILFLLLIPLGIADTLRINNQNNLQITEQISQQETQIQNFKQQLNAAISTEEITGLLRRARLQSPDINSPNPDQLKRQAITKISQVQQETKTQLETKLKDQQFTLLKNSVRYLLGALICGVLCIYAWRITFVLIKFVLA
jgi:cell division protein FtsL